MNDLNKNAARIAQYFFNALNRRTTPATMKQSIGQAKTLLNAGYTPEEIIIVINELVEHPPRDGLKSLGFLSYVMEDVLIKYKAKEVKKSFEKVKSDPNVDTFIEESRNVVRLIQPTHNRIGNEFDTSIF